MDASRGSVISQRVAFYLPRCLYRSVGPGGFVLNQRFDVGEGQRTAAVEALRERVLPPLADRKGITGVHLCLADESVSKVETAEKKARADTTEVRSGSR
jgi:hypothetical protein